MATEDLDDLDRKILDRIQTNFPLVSRPYAEIAREVCSTEDDVFARVERLREIGVVRQLSANFWATRLGYVSTLCAARVPEEKLAQFVDCVNAIPGVTHNYLRENSLNVWFTLICPSAEDAEKILSEITAETGIEVLNLPAEKIYKINVNFQMQEN